MEIADVKAQINQCLLGLLNLTQQNESWDEIDIELINQLQNLNSTFLSLLTPQRKSVVKINKYMENVVAAYSAKQFQENFRLTRVAFQFVLDEIRCYMPMSTRKSQIDIEKQFSAVLWLLSTPESYRSVSERFSISKCALSSSFVRIVNAINKLSGRYITWPSGNKRRYVQKKFAEQNQAFRGCVGLIDGTYVKIKAPRDQVRSYTNRKCFTSMTLQCICDFDKKFINVYTGWPSSVPDIRIFKNSHIYTQCETDLSEFFDDGEYILGGKGYQGGADWCVVPFTIREATSEEHIRFNKIHSKIRTKVENSFALLFGRFRRFKDLDMNREDWIPATIMACCVLHNICLDHNDPNVEEYCQEGLEYLEAVNQLPDITFRQEGDAITSEACNSTRERIFQEYQQYI